MEVWGFFGRIGVVAVFEDMLLLLLARERGKTSELSNRLHSETTAAARGRVCVCFFAVPTSAAALSECNNMERVFDVLTINRGGILHVEICTMF